MRVLIVTPHYWPEPFRVTDVAAGLRDRGHDVEILTALPDYPGGRLYEGYGLRGPYHEEHDGIRVTRVPVVPRGRGGAVRLLLNYGSFALGSMIAMLFTPRRWDVVLGFQLSPVTALLPAIVLRALHRTPLVAWVQDLWPESVRATGVGRSRLLYAIASAVSGWIYRRCDELLGTSRAFGPRLAAQGVCSDRIGYLPQWAEKPSTDVESGSAIPVERWSEGFPVMFAGNLGRVQALDTLLDAAEGLRRDEDIRWVFLGDGSLREWLEEEVVRRDLHDRVFLLGRRPPEEMPRYFSRAAALVVSLKPDDTMALTIPAKVQSYLAAGRPIVGSIDGEAARVIEDSGAGFTAAAGDGAALARIVERLKALPAPERDEMGRSGRAYSDLHFERERCLDRLERALAEAAPRRRNGSASPPAD